MDRFLMSRTVNTRDGSASAPSFRRIELIVVLLMGMASVNPGLIQGQPSPVPNGASVQLVDGGFRFTEGPVWFEEGLLFSDIPANTVYRWTSANGTNVFLQPSGRANGLAVDREGRLLLAQHEGQIGRRTSDATVESLVSSYGGRRLNSPNDLTVASDGSIYFTDPPYGVDEEERQLGFSGVYRLTPDGELLLLSKAFARPNGICLSPRDSTLYVTDSRETEVWTFDVREDGSIDNGRRFATPEMKGAEGTTDGLTVDERGNVYTTGPGGVWVYSAEGNKIGRIAVPKAPTNVAFGGPDRRTLYITARAHVYKIELNVPGAQ